MQLLKITFDLPDWAVGKHINVFAGSELLGRSQVRLVKKRLENGEMFRRTYYLPFEMKLKHDDRCSGCGACCESGGPFAELQMIAKIMKDYPNLKPRDTTKCPMLGVGNTGCMLGSAIPFSCVKAFCGGPKGFDKCTENLIVLEVL